MGSRTSSWPGVAGERTATGNDGMVKALAATPNSVGCAGVSFRDAIKTAGLGTALVKNQNGKFVLPNAETITAGASELELAHSAGSAVEPRLCPRRPLLPADQL